MMKYSGYIPKILQNAIFVLSLFAIAASEKVRNRTGYSSLFPRPQSQKSNRTKPSILKYLGYSLPEMLIALATSSLLIITLMKQYVGVKQHYKRSETLLEQALDVQLVSDLIRNSIRQAGFTPCLGIEYLSSIDVRNQYQNLTSIVIHPGGTHGVQLNHMSDHYGVVLRQISPNGLTVSNEAVFSRQRPVIIADCHHAEVHPIESLHHGSGRWEIHLQHALVYVYHPPIYIGEWLEEQYFTQSNVLYYSLGHVDALSNVINDLSVQLVKRVDKRLLHLKLTLENGHFIKFDTMVRGA